jgi:hypothetical protein
MVPWEKSAVQGSCPAGFSQGRVDFMTPAMANMAVAPSAFRPLPRLAQGTRRHSFQRSPADPGRTGGLGRPVVQQLLDEGILGGTPEHWAQYGRAYRAAWAEAGHAAERADIAVAVHGFVAESGTRARSTYLEYEHRMMAEGGAELGRPAPSRADRAAHHGPVGGMPQRDFLHGIELLGTKVLPQIRAEPAKP